VRCRFAQRFGESDSEDGSEKTREGPHAADELPKLLRALGVDPQKLASDDPAIMRSLERICISCGHKNQCQHDLAAGTAASYYRDYCPNAMSLDALFHSK